LMSIVRMTFFADQNSFSDKLLRLTVYLIKLLCKFIRQNLVKPKTVVGRNEVAHLNPRSDYGVENLSLVFTGALLEANFHHN
jgi:hypothetical protein